MGFGGMGVLTKAFARAFSNTLIPLRGSQALFTHGSLRCRLPRCWESHNLHTLPEAG
jgi:hypothetical protein